MGQLFEFSTISKFKKRIRYSKILYYIVIFLTFQDSDGGGGCPFCRAEIKGTESIVVDPFSPGHRGYRAAENGGCGINVGNLIDCDIDEPNEPEAASALEVQYELTD